MHCYKFCAFCTQGWLKPYIYRYIRYTHGMFSREITIHTVIYGADIRFWPTLHSFTYCVGSVQPFACAMYSSSGSSYAYPLMIMVLFSFLYALLTKALAHPAHIRIYKSILIWVCICISTHTVGYYTQWNIYTHTGIYKQSGIYEHSGIYIHTIEYYTQWNITHTVEYCDVYRQTDIKRTDMKHCNHIVRRSHNTTLANSV
jgi:hypothetical protein